MSEAKDEMDAIRQPYRTFKSLKPSVNLIGGILTREIRKRPKNQHYAYLTKAMRIIHENDPKTAYAIANRYDIPLTEMLA